MLPRLPGSTWDFHCIVGIASPSSIIHMLYSDVTSQNSFDRCRDWVKELDSMSATGRRILIGNKSDLETERVIPIETAQKLADELQMPYIECSAKNGNNVDLAFTQMAKLILDQGPPPSASIPPEQKSSCF
ncbi:Ras family [Pelomyxa schiedti]|nr:Ras family [Pelomyxa schiedti]